MIVTRRGVMVQLQKDTVLHRRLMDLSATEHTGHENSDSFR